MFPEVRAIENLMYDTYPARYIICACIRHLPLPHAVHVNTSPVNCDIVCYVIDSLKILYAIKHFKLYDLIYYSSSIVNL